MFRSLYHDDKTTLECFTCRRECDPEEETITELDGYPQCEVCRESCYGCCEWITDATIATFGPVVCFRDWPRDGKLTAAHAQCAAEYILYDLDRDFDYDHSTREEIAAMVERSQPRRLEMSR